VSIWAGHPVKLARCHHPVGVLDPIRHVAVFLCLVLLGIYWVRLAEVRGYTLEAYHVGMLAVIGTTFVDPRGIRSALLVLRRSVLWMLPYCIYLLFLLPAVKGTGGVGIWVRQIFFITGFVAVATYFYGTRNIESKLRIGGFCGIGFFLLAVDYSARQIGKDSISAVVEFLSSGNFQALLYKFLRPVFNALVKSDGDLAFVASVTNAVAVSLFVLLVLFRIGFRRRGLDLNGIIVTGLVILLVLLLNARSVLLVAVASVLLAGVVRLVMTRGISGLGAIYATIGAIGIFGAAAAAVVQGETTVAAISSIYMFDDNSTQSRIEQFRWAIGLVESNLIAGNGYMENESGMPIHNLFLSSWAYVGLFGFLPVLVFYVALVVVWARWLCGVVARPDSWVLEARPEWVCVLPVLPLFRVWVSGGGGHLAFGEWVALGVFIGLILRNAREQRRVIGMDQPGLLAPGPPANANSKSRGAIRHRDGP
jgi:hypothetical protein